MSPLRETLTSIRAAWLLGALVLGGPGYVVAYTTLPAISVSRSFSPSSAAPGQKVTITLSLKVGAIGSSPLRGLYLSESLPDVLTPASDTVKVNGAAIAAVKESLGPGALYSSCKTVRWVLEKAPGFSENHPLAASSTLVVTYEVTVPSTASGNLTFPGLGWVGMIPSLGDSGDHFGFEDTASTLPVMSPPKLTLSPPSLSFSAEEGGSNPASEAVLASNSGGGVLPPLSSAITYLSGGGWLTVTTSGSGNSQSLENSVDLAALSPDTYAATVKVSASGASNTPQSYTVSLVVSARPSKTQPTLDLSPTTLHFAVEEGGTAPPQTVSISNRGVGTLAQVSPSVHYVVGSGWLTVSASGSDNSQHLENLVLASTLAPGTYQATVSVASSGASNTPQSFVVFLDVTPRPGADAGAGGDPGARDGGATEMRPAEAGAGAARMSLSGGCAVAGSGRQPLPWVLLLVVAATLRRSRSHDSRRRFQ